MGDFDNDGDLDIYGLNWLIVGASFNDATFNNNGSGVYAAPITMSGSSSDDNEADFFDYNLDGNLDVFVANFNVRDQLVKAAQIRDFPERVPTVGVRGPVGRPFAESPTA